MERLIAVLITIGIGACAVDPPPSTSSVAQDYVSMCDPYEDENCGIAETPTGTVDLATLAEGYAAGEGWFPWPIALGGFARVQCNVIVCTVSPCYGDPNVSWNTPNLPILSCGVYGDGTTWCETHNFAGWTACP